MKTFSALLTLCEDNSLVTGEIPSESPVTRSFDVFAPEQTAQQIIGTPMILLLNKLLSK